MFNVTTKYDKIYDESTSEYVRKKVFMIRGDEAYAKTTDIILTYSTPVIGDSKGLKTNLTATVHRKIGASKVVFYDGEEILGMVDIGTGVSTVYLNNVYLSYGVEHELYAVFKGNDSCLSSKSSKNNITVPVPPELLPTISFNNTVSQIDEGEDPSINVTVTLNGEPVKNTPIIFYVNNEYLTTINTDNQGNILTHLYDLDKGIYTITASIEGVVSFNNASSEHTILSGYNIDFIEYPSTILTNSYTKFMIKVTDLLGNAVSNKTVTLADEYTDTTYSTGIVAFVDKFNFEDGSTVTAKCGGSSNEVTVNTFTVTSVTVTSDDKLISKNIEGRYTLLLNGVGTMNNIPIHLDYGIGEKILYFSDNTPQTITIKGQSIGELNLSIEVGLWEAGGVAYFDSYIIDDVLQYYTPFKQYYFDYTTTGEVVSSTDGLLFKGRANSYIRFESPTSIERPIENSNVTYRTPLRLEFDVISASNTNFSIGLESYNLISHKFNAGDHVKLIHNHSNDTLNLYVNNNLVNSISCKIPGKAVNKWVIQTSNQNIDNSLKITNLIVL